MSGGGKSGDSGISRILNAAFANPEELHSTAYARVLDAVSEGEVFGLVDGLKSIYLDETPLQNADDSMNFKNVHVEVRVGTLHQEPMQGFPDVESETAVGVALEADTPWVQAFTNLSLTGVRVRLAVAGLSETDPEDGKRGGYEVAYRIEVATDAGAYITVFEGSFKGLATSQFERSHNIDLPEATDTGWLVRVTRLTPDTSDQYISDDTSVVSYTELIHANLRYPHTALVGVIVDASQFRSVPRRAYDMKGRLIRVPTNYDPDTREYATVGPGTDAGAWDGTFKVEWTDNPAWIYYDMATHPRYGMGHLVSDAQVDKWSLYGIAQYCDELVDDGRGGEEPRFTCNIYLQRQADAYKVLQDLASVFRGMSYWAGGQIVSVADRPSTPTYTFNNSNVIGGKFQYSGTSRRARHSVALVGWIDMSDFGRGKIEYVTNDSAVARYGVQPLDITAIACTSQGQAHRMGMWALLSEQLETNTVSFECGLDGTIPQPGEIILIADEHRAGRRIGGRVRAATTTVITVDALPAEIAIGDTFSVVLPDGSVQERVVDDFDAINRTVEVSVAFDAAPVVGAQWLLQSAELEAQHFRVIGVEEKGAIELTYKVLALQKNESKFDAVDFGFNIQVPSTALVPSRVIAPPTDVVVSTYEKVSAALPVTVLQVDWTAVEGAVGYTVSVRRDLGDWSAPANVQNNRYEQEGVAPGSWQARVVAIGYRGNLSTAALSSEEPVGEAIFRDVIVVMPVAGVATINTALGEQFELTLTGDTALAIDYFAQQKTFILHVINPAAWDLTLPAIASSVPAAAYTATPTARDKLGFQTLDGGANITLHYLKDV